MNDAQYLINIDFCIFPSYTDRQENIAVFLAFREELGRNGKCFSKIAYRI